VFDLSYDSPMSAGFGLVLLLTAIATAQSPALRQDWKLVRSAPSGSGGTVDFVLIPKAKQRDRDHYKEVGDAVCGSRTTCMVFFWIDRTHVPTRNDGLIPISDLAAMTATYERSPKYREPMLNLVCLRDQDCAYLQSTKSPPDK